MTVTSSVSSSLERGLRFLGLWPNVPYSDLNSLIFLMSIVIVQYFQYSYIFAHLKLKELPNLVDGLSITVDYTLSIFKLTVLWIHRRMIHQMLIAMNDDWRICSNIEQHLNLMTIKANISHFCCNAMVNLNIIVGLIYFLGNYAIRFLYVTDHNETLWQPPMKIQFPLEIEQSPFFYLLVVILIVHVMLNVYTAAVVNALIFTLVLHASGQIDVICYEFRTIFQKVSLSSSSSSVLELLIERHSKIISFSDHIDKIFSFIALMQIFWNTIVICCIGILIMTFVYSESDIVSLVKSILGYVVIMVEIFIFCFAGEHLSFKSISIAHAVYESMWYNMPFKQSKIISFIIMRSQKRLTISAWGVMDLSLETFASIMKASASYISILYAMY